MDYAPSPRHAHTNMDPPLVSRTPSPCFWKDDTSGVLLQLHLWLWNNHSPEAQTHGACYASYDGERNQIEAAVTTSAKRAPCPRCFFPFVPKNKRPCTTCQKMINYRLTTMRDVHGPTSNRWTAPEIVTSHDAELFNEMKQMLQGKALHCLAEELWSRTDGDLLTSSTSFITFMNRISLEMRRVVAVCNDQGEVTIPPDQQLRKALWPLISQLPKEQA